MADLRFKKTMTSVYPLYPIFERYAFNIAASLLFVFFTTHCVIGNHVLFTLPKIVWAAGIVGWPLFLYAQQQMMKNLMLPFPVKDLLYKPELEFELEPTQKKRGLTTKGMYGVCRNPMYAGVFAILIGASRIVTVDRLLFNLLLIGGTYYGVLREEAKMRLEFSDYEEYCQKVPNRFLPVLSNITKIF